MPPIEPTHHVGQRPLDLVFLEVEDPPDDERGTRFASGQELLSGNEQSSDDARWIWAQAKARADRGAHRHATAGTR